MTQTTSTTTTPNPSYIAVDPLARPAKPPSDPARIEAAKDVKTLLNGHGTVEKKKYGVVGDKIQPGDTSKKGETTTFVKRSIAERVNDMQNDFKNLCGKGGDGPNTFKSYSSTVEKQIAGLKKALKELDKKSGENYTPAEQKLVTESKNQIKTAESEIKRLKELNEAGKSANSGTSGPDKCNPQTVTKPVVKPKPQSDESKTLKDAINSIPLMSQEQKDGTRKALESTGVPKIIKDSINGGKDYWEKTGKPALKTALDTLVNTGKIAAVIAVFILEFVGQAVTNPFIRAQDTTQPADSTTIANAVTSTTDKTPVNPTSAANLTSNGAITPRNGEDTAFIINNPTTTANTGNRDTAFIIPTTATSQDKQDTAFVIQNPTANTGKRDTAFIINNPTATANTDKQDTAFIIPIDKNTALTGGESNTALTGGTSTTAFIGGKTQEPNQQQMTPS